ncbi:MAG TPA: hypothetical protein VHE30_12855 [Polyangiaceae bacterium]|nr:hypothetical protein [Polyangiaceae bacterium]
MLELVSQIVLGIVYTSAVVRGDQERLSPERRRRAWNSASFWSAVVAFGPLCIPVHFARTRRSVPGFLLGVFWMALVIVALSLSG